MFLLQLSVFTQRASFPLLHAKTYEKTYAPFCMFLIGDKSHTQTLLARGSQFRALACRQEEFLSALRALRALENARTHRLFV